MKKTMLTSLMTVPIFLTSVTGAIEAPSLLETISDLQKQLVLGQNELDNLKAELSKSKATDKTTLVQFSEALPPELLAQYDADVPKTAEQLKKKLPKVQMKYLLRAIYLSNPSYTWDDDTAEIKDDYTIKAIQLLWQDKTKLEKLAYKMVAKYPPATEKLNTFKERMKDHCDSKLYFLGLYMYATKLKGKAKAAIYLAQVATASKEIDNKKEELTMTQGSLNEFLGQLVSRYAQLTITDKKTTDSILF